MLVGLCIGELMIMILPGELITELIREQSFKHCDAKCLGAYMFHWYYQEFMIEREYRT